MLPSSSCPDSPRLVEDRRAELGEPEQAKCALAVVIEDAQIVGLVQIPQDHDEMSAVALLGRRKRQLIGDELVDTFRGELRQ